MKNQKQFDIFKNCIYFVSICIDLYRFCKIEMKNLFVLLIVIIAFSCNTQNGEKSSGENVPFMFFAEEKHDFGKVAEGEMVTYTFKVENKGKADLILLDVTTSCGCTVADFDKKPIKKGESGFIQLKFDTRGRSGKVTKTATVVSNATPESKDLQLIAEIISNK